MNRSSLTALGAAVVLTAAALAGSASAMTVREFLTTADGIPRNPTAMLRSDTRRLMREVQGGFKTVRDEQVAARAAGRRPATCMPERVSVNPSQLLARFNAIPASRRNITVTQAIREWMAAEHPCPAA